MNRIRELREEKKITQIRLSIELEVSQETISAYEMEKYYPSVKSLIKLQNIFGVSIDYILGLSDTRYERIETNSLAQDETRLINLYRKLDSLGKERITSYLEGYINALEAQQKNPEVIPPGSSITICHMLPIHFHTFLCFFIG